LYSFRTARPANPGKTNFEIRTMRKRSEKTSPVLIADDHGLYRTGLSLLLRDNLGIDEVIEVATFDDALDKLAARPEIHLALFDLSMPGMGGPESLGVLRQTYPSLRVAIVSGSENRDDVMRAIAMGLTGFVPKSLSEPEIVAALRGILEDRIYVPRFMTAIAAEVRTPHPSTGNGLDASKPPVSLEELTPRQRDVLASLSRGLSNKQIAHELDIAEGTVKIHLAALFAHCGARNRTELLARVHALGRTA
jgi:DNA-binding NarL/FixJ family response regulator